MNSGDHKQYYRVLGRLLRTARARVLLRGVLATLAVGTSAFALAAWVLGTEAGVPVGIKITLGLSCSLLTAGALWGLLLAPLRRLASRTHLCQRLEERGSFNNILLAADEAVRRPERWGQSPRVSGELVRRLLRAAVQRASELRIPALLPLAWAGRSLLAPMAALVLLVVLLGAAPQRAERGAARLLRPWLSEGRAATSGLYLEPGPSRLVAGESTLLSALDFGLADGPVLCETRSGTGLWRPLPCQLDTLSFDQPYRRWQAQVKDVRESFAYRFRRDNLATPAQDVTVLHPPMMAELSGQVVPPAYTNLPPQPLPRLPSSLEILAGSQLRWQGRANHALRWAAVVTEAADTLALTTAGEDVSGGLRITEPLRYSFSLLDDEGLRNTTRLDYAVTVAKDLIPLVDLRRPDDDGLLPVAGKVQLVGEATDDFGLTEVNLLCRREAGGNWPAAGDTSDAGWQRLTLWSAAGARRSGTPPAGSQQKGSAGQNGGADQRSPASLSLQTDFGPLTVEVVATDSTFSRLSCHRVLELLAGDLQLIPGDVLALRLEALDNRRPGKPGRGLSRVLRLNVPSATEILMSQAVEEQDRLQGVAELRRRNEELSGDLERLHRELLKNPVPDWDRQQEIAAALKEQKALQDELRQLADQLQNDMTSLLENRLTSPELAEKMDQIAALLADNSSDELDRLLQMLQDAVAKLSQDDIRDSLAQITATQQQTVEKLDRALSLLKQLSREQELGGMTELVAQLIRQQQDLLDEARAAQAARDSSAEAKPGDQAAPSDQQKADGHKEPAAQEQQEKAAGQKEGGDQNQEMAERQQALAQEMERLAEKLKEALQKVQDEQAAGDSSLSAQKLQEALDQAMREMSERKTGKSMKKAAQQLKDNQPMTASEQQEQAMRDLAVLYHVMLMSQQSMQMALMQHQVMSLRRLAADLLSLSSRQEEIADEVPSDLRDIQTADLTHLQFRVLKATRALRNRLQELSASSPRESERLIKKLDELVVLLDQSVKNLQENRGSLAQRSSRQSLGDMNRLIIALLTEAQKSCSGSGGGSCSLPSMSQQLQQMARDQAGLNGQAEQLREQMARQGLSQEIRAQMQRLQADQGQLAGQAQDLAELQRQLPDGERPLGDLGQLAQEMESVVQDLDQGLVNDQTLLRQQRILSRLLDAQNSVRERDYTSRRESRTADQLFTQLPPGQLAEAAPQPGAPFQQRYEPVEKAPVEYRDLVRLYFQTIGQLQQPSQPPSPPPAAGGARP